MKKIDSENHQPKILKFLLLAILVALIGSSTAAYGQDVFTDFEFNDTSGAFTLGTSPKSVTFTGGLSQTVGQPPLYFSGTHSFMVTQGNTATITFETPAASVTLWLRDQSNTSVLRVFDQDDQILSSFNATTGFVQINLAPDCGKLVGSITLQNNGAGFAVIDDFSFTAGQVTSSTVLVANFIHGNTDLFRSRVYLWNPSMSCGDITVRVFTMPRPAPSDPPEPSQLLGTLPLGTLEAESARTIRIEEVLSDLGTITQPYTENGGNLMLEFAIKAAGVRGAAQVFNNSFTLAFGTYPLQEILSTSNVSPTVLVANFIHGNTTLFRSRVYLWNPSMSFGDIMVRVFTMPRPAPSDPPEPSQLLGTVPLGTLEGESARTIRIEEVLSELSTIIQPYTENGGNLMLEFTIEAAGVRGAAQVFNNSFTLAFGTYPLQVVP